MPGCAAIGCNNRSEKGYIMKCFPRDPKLRKIWQERVARADWEPSNNSFLCHVHFEPEEWSILPNGRIRLKKNAVPSIFTITSTRKSPKKRGRLMSIKKQNECENEYMMEYLENDTEHSSIDLLEEKNSDSQDIDDPSIKSLIYQRVKHSLQVTEDKQVSYRQYRDIMNNLEQNSIILISDDNTEMEDNSKECNNEKQANVESKNSVDNCVADENLTNNQNQIFVKVEVKRENDQTSLDSYDEIEEKLKQICDGDREESISRKVKRLNSTSNNREKVIEKSVTQVPILHRSINYKYSSKDEIGSLLTDDTENIEIIFGSESGGECTWVPKSTSYDNNETIGLDKTDPCKNIVSDVTNNQETIQETKNVPETIETAFQGKTIQVTPNMRAAIKRKRRTREEIMKSIKKSIRNPSSRDTNSMSDSDISDNISKRENKTEEELNTSENTAVPAVTKFTVKVSGDREDIFDIMQDLSKDTKEFTIQECKDNYVRQGNNTFVTSIITIDDSPEEVFIKKEHINIKDENINQTSVTSRDNDEVSPNSSSLKNDECSSARLMSHFEEENNLRVNSFAALDINSVNKQSKCTKHECRKLQQKVKVQEDVIKELTNQLILYKNLEKNLQNKNLALEAKTKKMENMMCEFNTKTDGATSSTSAVKKNMDRKLLDDLTNRVNYLEEVNKKLMKTVTVEGQYKRKLEGQIKQKDNRIKELNWKLEKASKFLDRSEKNTNTYRRKMLNMQTFMRRKKIMDEKMSRFNEMLMDNAKDGYAEKTIVMAMEIKEICGASGYNKLLNFGFPLPSLSSLRTSQRNNSSDSNESGNATLQASPSKYNVNEETDVQAANDDAETDTRNQVLESICEEIDATNEEDTEETIMGTVQDIFEENNDIDDFSTNELREHFISQLNAVM